MWTLLIVLPVLLGAWAVFDAPDRARRHASERRSVLIALADLPFDGTAIGVSRTITRRSGLHLPDRIIRAHLAALEEDGLVSAGARGRAVGGEPRYRLLVDGPKDDEMPTPDTPSTLTIYHDGGCPLCAAEIGHYRRARGAQALTFQDVGVALPPQQDLTREMALARFHVREASGKLLSGAAAFAALWQALPGWRWLGRIVGTWPVLPLAELLYRAFLPLRPRLAGALVALGILKPVRGRRSR